MLSEQIGMFHSDSAITTLPQISKSQFKTMLRDLQEINIQDLHHGPPGNKNYYIKLVCKKKESQINWSKKEDIPSELFDFYKKTVENCTLQNEET